MKDVRPAVLDKLLCPAQVLVDGTFRTDWAVGIREGDITYLGPAKDAGPAQATIGLPQHALVPGAVSTHTHSFQYLLRGFGDDLPFLEWRERGVYKYSLNLSADDLYTGALLCFGELLRHGCTTITDFFYHIFRFMAEIVKNIVQVFVDPLGIKI